MTILINNPKTEKLVRQLVSITGQSEEALIEIAVEKLLELEPEYLTIKTFIERPTSTSSFTFQQTASKTQENLSMKEKLLEIARSFNSLPTLDNRTPDEIMGYDENGLSS